MPKNKSTLLFSNPHGNHSYFTVLALSKNYNVISLCPPLSLQLIFRRWKCIPQFRQTDSFVYFISFACLIAFLAYRMKLIKESHYLYIFNLAVEFILSRLGPLHWYHYQDYTFVSPNNRKNILSDICEVIIDSPVGTANRQTTLQALEIADKIIFPTLNMSLHSSFSTKVLCAPYGGNKVEYIHSSPSHYTLYATDSHTVLKVTARANSIRKGSVQFLKAIHLISQYIAQSSLKLKLQVTICGDILEPESLYLYNQVKNSLDDSSHITINSKRFAQHDYLSLLRSSDLFILPTSLESSSLAALEALWTGIPSILTVQAGIDCFRNDRHGILLENNSEQSIYSSVLSIINNLKLLDVYRHNLITDREDFTWSRYISLLSSIELENPI